MSTNMRHVMALVLVATSLQAGCTTSNEAPASVDSSAVPSLTASDSLLPLRMLLKEFSSGITDSTRTVVTDSASWANLAARVYINHGRLANSDSTVDFAREMVVLVGMGSRATGGYSISVDSARTTATALQVYVQSTSPGPTCGTTSALTQPVHAVALPRTSLPVQFVELTTTTDCR